jgi:5-methylcytosine-specific restriction endonuclease McrA
MTAHRTDLLADIRRRAASVGHTLEQVLLEKDLELRLRLYWKCVPRRTVKDDDIPGVVRLVAGPSFHELISTVVRGRRGPRVSAAVIEELETRQRGLCSVCGRRLDVRAKPHVDHITPVALGGTHESENFQLLCGECNSGKAAHLHWLMSAPFFLAAENGISPRLRYGVLQHYHGECQKPGCLWTCQDCEVFVVSLYPAELGVRPVFDNLTVYCKEHYEELLKEADARLDELRSGFEATSEQTELDSLAPLFDWGST